MKAARNPIENSPVVAFAPPRDRVSPEISQSVAKVENQITGYSNLFTINPTVPPDAPLRKYLFSATLTRNPAKIAQLHLQNPLFFQSSATSRFKLPDSLHVTILPPFSLTFSQKRQSSGKIVGPFIPIPSTNS